MDDGQQMALVHTYFHLLQTIFNVYQKALIMVSVHAYLPSTQQFCWIFDALFPIAKWIDLVKDRNVFPHECQGIL